MRIGINGTRELSTLDGAIDLARRAAADGFDSFWIAQVFGLDALTALAVIGRQVPDIELGTAVVPTYPRHPMMMAGQALTVQAATDDRLVLGIGLSHRIVVEDLWGYSFDRPARHMREYLDALLPLLRAEPVDLHGETLTAVGALDVTGASAPPVLVAALGPDMLRITGERGCGTITWCTGERALATHIVPRITAAAAAGGQPPPRIVAGLPIAVTADIDGTKESIAAATSIYGGLPSYRAMLDIEGADGPADIALVGDEESIVAAVGRLADAGVTELSAVISATNPADRAATWDLLRSLRS